MHCGQYCTTTLVPGTCPFWTLFHTFWGRQLHVSHPWKIRSWIPSPFFKCNSNRTPRPPCDIYFYLFAWFHNYDAEVELLSQLTTLWRRIWNSIYRFMRKLLLIFPAVGFLWNLVQWRQRLINTEHGFIKRVPIINFLDYTLSNKWPIFAKTRKLGVRFPM